MSQYFSDAESSYGHFELQPTHPTVDLTPGVGGGLSLHPMAAKDSADLLQARLSDDRRRADEETIPEVESGHERTTIGDGASGGGGAKLDAV